MFPPAFFTEGRAMEDVREVLAALRLGWCVAEMRGRNRPGGPNGDLTGMPDYVDRPLPLRIERDKAELRIEVQTVVAGLARQLHVDDSAAGVGFGAALEEKTKLLSHARAPRAAAALGQALEILLPPATGQVGDAGGAPSATERALQVLNDGRAAQ
jgi:hypothetical protein